MTDITNEILTLEHFTENDRVIINSISYPKELDGDKDNSPLKLRNNTVLWATDRIDPLFLEELRNCGANEYKRHDPIDDNKHYGHLLDYLYELRTVRHPENTQTFFSHTNEILDGILGIHEPFVIGGPRAKVVPLNEIFVASWNRRIETKEEIQHVLEEGISSLIRKNGFDQKFFDLAVANQIYFHSIRTHEVYEPAVEISYAHDFIELNSDILDVVKKKRQVDRLSSELSKPTTKSGKTKI